MNHALTASVSNFLWTQWQSEMMFFKQQEVLCDLKSILQGQTGWFVRRIQNAATTKWLWVRPLPHISHADVALKQLKSTASYHIQPLTKREKREHISTVDTYSTGIQLRPYSIKAGQSERIRGFWEIYQIFFLVNIFVCIRGTWR